jgi:hypothetical protein
VGRSPGDADELRLAAVALAQAQGRPAGNPLFNLLTGYTFALCASAGIFLTADSLSEEKRDGTLGLLFLTDLEGLLTW